MKNVLITGSLPASIRKDLEGAGLEISHYGVSDLVEPEKFKKAIENADIYISGGYEEGKAEIIAAAQKLKLIAFLGVDAGAFIDIPACTKKQVKVCNTPGANAISVAEFAFGLMLDAQRRISQSAVATMMPENNPGYSYKTGNTLYGKTIGLIGFGRIGQHLAKMAMHGFNARVLYHSRSGAKSGGNGAEFVSIDDLISQSDIISLHVPRDSGVILDKSRFEKMKPGVTIINTCSASLCDPDALLAHLKKDPKAICAFDGLDEEGVKEENPAITELKKLGFNQLVVTPHVAWRTDESNLATLEMALESIKDMLAGKAPRNAVN